MDTPQKITNRPVLPTAFHEDSLGRLVKQNLPGIDETLEARGTTHGDFYDNAKVIQGMKDLAREGSSWSSNSMTKVEREAVDMILHKVGRIVNGDPHFDDHWADIIGYAELVRKDNSEK